MRSERYLPTIGPDSCGDLGFFVRRDVNLEVGQGVEVVELLDLRFGNAANGGQGRRGLAGRVVVRLVQEFHAGKQARRDVAGELGGALENAAAVRGSAPELGARG